MSPLERPAQPSVGTNTGALAAAAWCAARELFPRKPLWSVEIALDNTPDGDLDRPPADARFSIEIFSQEWGFAFRRGDAVSWIRITDVPFVHGRDDFGLLRRTPRLEHVGTLLRELEEEHTFVTDRLSPLIRSDVGGLAQIAAWIRAL